VASRVVDGQRIPLSLDGDPVLDLCNTRAAWGSPAPKEYLVSYPALAVWARESGLLNPTRTKALIRLARRDEPGALEVVTRAIAFRSALYDVLVGAASRRSWALLAAESAHAAAAARLVAGRPATWTLPPSTGLELPLASVVRAADELLTSTSMTEVRACPMPDCGWLFADPRGRRRWCSMAWCGNRAKVRRHAERQRQDEARDAVGPGTAQ
jgi:predicted RNA-binding Zn ribbon-like protein